MYRKYHVYVIELEELVRGRKAVYVGETRNPPERRFEIHKAGGRTSSRVVLERGVRVRPDLAPQRAFDTVEEALAEERRLGSVLRAAGYEVHGAQGTRFSFGQRER